MSYSLPRPIYEKLVETLQDKQAAEGFATSIEETISEIERTAQRETVEKTAMIKTEIRDDLSRTLVTRELFEERFLRLEEGIDQRFRLVDERFKRTELWLKFLVGLSVAGFTVFNPGFLAIVKLLFK